MGKKRIVTTDPTLKSESQQENAGKEGKKNRIDSGVLHVESTYNNTKLVLTDKRGNVFMTSSSGALGFKGAKKGTPFAAAKVGETLGLKAHTAGLRDISVVVKGVGAGRESSIRGFISKGISISSIKDATPVPHNGTKQKKPRRV